MAKYNYDKKYLKGLGVGPFLKQVKVRNQHIEAASDELKPFDYVSNKLVEQLHPEYQLTKVSKVIEREGAKSFVLTSLENKPLAYFRAGQYVVLDIKVGDIIVSRPFSISSSPKETLGNNSNYMITIKDNKDGFSSKEVNKNWHVGQEVKISGPQGEFYYQGLRDAKHVVGVAGGSGITPFIAMAEAIADGTEDFNLTIIYGAKNRDALLFKEELDKLAKQSKKIKVVYVLEDKDGFITSQIIKKYVEGDFSLFVCGPRGLYYAMDKVASELKLTRRRFRKEVFGEYGDPTNDKDYPKEFKDKTFKLTVIMRDKRYELTCHSNETLLNAMEKGGVHAPSRCRSGECGWCHSLLVSGKIYTPKEVDGRRIADSTFNWIHPCASYPLSDIVLEVPYNK
ncbi:MAG: iron-sulfur cluster-binding domain-containing protein [Bacilli bacterium]|nr:iron-sulfur cluster-binding domain-containing protein [Bacilli bacterium]